MVGALNDLARQFYATSLGVDGGHINELEREYFENGAAAGGAVFATDLANVAGLSATSYHDEAADGNNIRPALIKAIAAIKAGAPSTLTIPYRAGGWTVSSQVLFDLSNFTLILDGDVTLTSTTRQKTFLFAYDVNQQPAQALHNVSLYGNGHVVDGNGAAMTFSYSHGDGSDNDSAIRFNYVDNVYVERVHSTNGPIDSFSLRQCRNWLIRKCIFSNSKEDNGFSATTDWPGYTYGDLDTYGWGAAEDCLAYDNQDLGMTAYNCSGVWFTRCESHDNGGGFSYEDNNAAPNIKRYDGGFRSCHAYNCPERGWYVDADGVSLDDDCKSWNIRGYVGTDTAGFFGNGVVFSNARYGRIGGTHTNNARYGAAIFNGSGHLLDITVTGRFNDNDSTGLYARGIDRLEVTPQAEFMRNGLVLVDGSYGRGIDISNSGGSTYLQDTGFVKIVGATAGGNGLGAIKIQYVKEISIDGVQAPENCQMAADRGIDLYNASRARVYNTHSPNTRVPVIQTFCLAFQSSVSRSFDRGNTGDATTGVIARSSGISSQGVNDTYSNTKTWDPGVGGTVPLAAGAITTTTITVAGADVGDDVSVTWPRGANIGGLIIWGEVTGTGSENVNIVLWNRSASPITPASATLRVRTTKRNPG